MVEQTKVLATMMLLAIGIRADDPYAHLSDCDLVDLKDVSLENYDEFCVKIVVLCYTIYDDPFSKADKKDYDTYIKRCQCVPKNLNHQDELEYWRSVRVWEDEVRRVLLTVNVYDFADETDDSRNMRIYLNPIFRINKVISCNMATQQSMAIPLSRTTASTTTTTTTATTTTEAPTTTGTALTVIDAAGCNKSSVLGAWTEEQMELADRSDTFVDTMPKLLEHMDSLASRNCCPYRILRDRLEAIDDSVDTLYNLSDAEFFGRGAYTGYASLDFKDLMQRIDLLNFATAFTNNSFGDCCLGWNAKIAAMMDAFEVGFASITNFTKIIGIYNSLTANQNALIQEAGQVQDLLKKITQANEGDFDSDQFNSKDKCCSTTNNHLDIKVIAFDEFDQVATNQLNARVSNTSAGLEHAKFLMGMEQKKVQELMTLCDEMEKEMERRRKQISKSNNTLNLLQANVQNVQGTVSEEFKAVERPEHPNFQDIATNRTQNMELLEGKLTELEKKVEDTRAEAIQKKQEFIKLKQDFPTDCWEKMNHFIDLSELSSNFSSNMTNFEDRLRKVKLDLPKQQFAMINLFETINAKIMTLGTTDPGPGFHKQTEQVEELLIRIDIMNTSPLNISSASHNVTESVLDFRKELANMLESEKQWEEEDNEMHSKIKELLVIGIHRFYIQLNETIKKIDKLAKLEAVKQMREDFFILRNQTVEFTMNIMSNLTNFQNIIRELSEDLYKYDNASDNCLSVCDNGEMPSIASLEKRLEVLENVLKEKTLE